MFFFFSRHRHVSHLLGKENIFPPRKKNLFTDTDRKKCQPTSARKVNRQRSKKNSPGDPDRTFPNRHHPDIIQGLTRQNISRQIVATDIFQPTLRNCFYKHWPIIFFYGRGCFFVRCCRKNLQCWSARFFRSSSADVVFRPTLACFHLPSMENTNQPLQKKKHDCPILIEKNGSRRLLGKFGDRGLQKNHRVTQIEHFLLEIIQI